MRVERGPGRAVPGAAARPAGRGRREDGYVLPAVLLVLILLTLLAIASFESARLEGLAARSLAGSIRVFYAADGGLEALLAGVSAEIDTGGPNRVTVHARRERLLGLPDGGRLERLVADASGGGTSGTARTRRVLALLVAVDPDGAIRRRAWTEITRPGGS